MEIVCHLLFCLSFIHFVDFTYQQLAPSVGNFGRKAMAPAKKMVSMVESSEYHSMQEHIAKMMAMVEASAQQTGAASRALEETQIELITKIIELQRENQFLKEAQRKMQYDPCNPEIEDNEIDEEVLEQPKQKTPVARPVENPHHVEREARFKHHTPKNNEVKREDLEDWKAQILAEMTKKMGGYGRFTNPQDLAMLATRGVNRSLFMEWIVEEPKPKYFVVPSFKQFDGKSDPMDHIFNFQQKMALERRNEAILCKVFSTTLIGPALAWFRQLPEKSVDNFEDLCAQFIK